MTTPPAARERFVLCMKWGDKYGPEYVNRLYAMVARHLRGPFRFVCLTDSGKGVRPEVELAKCVDCLLCWVYCPDSAIVLEDAHFRGFDLEVCKGCEICSEVCPTRAIEMVAE